MQASLSLTLIVSALLSGVVGFLTSRLSQRAQRFVDRRTYRSAMLAEIRGLHQRLLEYETAFADRVVTGQVTGAELLHALLRDGDTVVFNNHASSIGLFDRQTALRIVLFYAQIRSVQGRALVLSERMTGGHGDNDVAMHDHLEFIRRVRRRAHLLVRRLRHRRQRHIGAALCLR